MYGKLPCALLLSLSLHSNIHKEISRIANTHRIRFVASLCCNLPFVHRQKHKPIEPILSPSSKQFVVADTSFSFSQNELLPVGGYDDDGAPLGLCEATCSTFHCCLKFHPLCPIGDSATVGACYVHLKWDRRQIFRVVMQQLVGSPANYLYTRCTCSTWTTVILDL